VGLGGEVEFRWRTPAADFEISTRVFASRNTGVGNIGNGDKQIAQFEIESCDLESGTEIAELFQRGQPTASQFAQLTVGRNEQVSVRAAFGAAGEGWLRVCFAQSARLMERAMQRLRDGIRAEMG